MAEEIDYNAETRKAYDSFADEFEAKFKGYAEQLNYLAKESKEFLKRVPEHGKILDIGCGTGTYALLFQGKGFDVTCIDFSESMVRKCVERGLNAKLMDFEELRFKPESFDGVWAYASLFHVPKKNFRKVLTKIARVLKPGGVFYLGLRQGRGEGLKPDGSHGTQRWFSLYTDKELRAILEQRFEVEFFSETKTDCTYLNYVLKKK